MFRLAVSPSFRAEVTGQLPGGVEFKFVAIFARMAPEAVDALVQDREITDTEVARRVLVGWDDVTDEQDLPLPFSPETMGALLSNYGVAAAIVRAWYLEHARAREKN